MDMGKGALYYDDYVLAISYFNQVIDAKPYLSEPYYYRGLAKFYLEDYEGTVEDCTQSINRNPFIMPVFQLRALCYIKRGDYGKAADDYDYILHNDPVTANKDISLWYNRILCRMELNDSITAWHELDTLLTKWPRYARAYDLKAQLCLTNRDTTQAVSWLNRSLSISPQNPQAWAFIGSIKHSSCDYDDADSCLTQAIYYEPQNIGYYLNRAVVRYQLGKYGEVLKDYDEVLKLDADNFLAHYNRGLLRAQVGDNNRAIADFDAVLKQEPDNMLARLNRAQLRQKTGDFKGAVADYTAILNSYPDFLYGYHQRSLCYLRLGRYKAAAADKDKIYVNQLDRFVSASTRRKNIKSVRKRSDKELESYQQLVVADNADSVMRPSYSRITRGLVQNQNVTRDPQPLLSLCFSSPSARVNGEPTQNYFLPEVERLNQKRLLDFRFELTTGGRNSVADLGGRSVIEKLKAQFSQVSSADHLLVMAMLDACLAHYANGLSTAEQALEANPHSVIALLVYSDLWLKHTTVHTGQPDAKNWRQLLDRYNLLLHNLSAEKAPKTSMWPLLYNRAYIEAQTGLYQQALSDYTQVLKMQPRMAEAWYNRGLLNLQQGQREQGLADLRRAGQLGLYTAYSILKQENAQ